MHKKLFVCFLATMITHAQDHTKPTLEQLMSSKSVRISVECVRDEENVNLRAWQEIVVAVNKLIDMCYAVDSDQDGNDLVFQEVHKTIDYIRDVQRTHNDHAIHGILNVSVGNPEEHQREAAA